MKSRVTSFRIYDTTKQKLDYLAFVTGKSKSELIEEALTLLFKHYILQGIPVSDELKKRIEEKTKEIVIDDPESRLLKRYIEKLQGFSTPATLRILRKEIVNRCTKKGEPDCLDILFLAEELVRIKSQLSSGAHFMDIKNLRNLIAHSLGIDGDRVTISKNKNNVLIRIRCEQRKIIITKTVLEFERFIDKLLSSLKENLSLKEVMELVKSELRLREFSVS